MAAPSFPYLTEPKPPSLTLLTFYMAMLLIVSQGVLRVGVFRVAGMMLIVMMRMMMPRMHLGYIVIGGRLLPVPAVPHLALLMLFLLGPWVHPCFRRLLTVSSSYKFRTIKSFATSRT